MREPIVVRVKELLDRFERNKALSWKKSNVFFRSNIYRIYLYSSDDIEDRYFRGAMLDEIDLMKVNFRHVSFSKTSFYRNRWENCRFENVNFLECKIDDCALADVTLERVKLSVRIRSCQAQGLWMGDSVLDTSCESFNLEGATIQDSAIDLRGSMYCRQTFWRDTALSIACSEEFYTHVEFSACKIERAAILGTPYEDAKIKVLAPEVVLRDCEFSKTGIAGVVLDVESFESLQNAAEQLYGFFFIKTPPMEELSNRNGLEFEDGLCWLSKSFVAIHWNSCKEGEILIPEEVIHAVSRLGGTEAVVSKCISQWRPYIVH